MARPAQITLETLRAPIRARGPISATELAALIKANRTTITRTLPDFGDELVTLGATRSTRYLLRRAIRQIGNRWPIYRINENGRPAEWAEIESLHDRHWRITWAGTPPEWAHHFTEENGLWSGFPFFLSDARPQGFLGRIIARQISEPLRLPEDPRGWDDEDTLIYLQAAGEDLAGNQILGDDCLRRALARSAALPTGRVTGLAEREIAYPARAREIAQNLPGSSAGGEQPKFLTTLQTETGNFQPVIVKFSAPMDQPTGRRWADLLLCEFHAHEVLAEAGLAEIGSQVLDFENRRFLQIPRFDRNGPGGRRGVVSLEALAAALGIEIFGGWDRAAAELLRRGLIDAETVSVVRRLSAFGELIGNTDMHFGNLSFFLDDSLPFRITPSYDMLPMLWAPGPQGELVARTFGPRPPLPATLEHWRAAAGWAENFWQRVARDPLLSSEFVGEAQTALETVRRLRQHVG